MFISAVSRTIANVARFATFDRAASTQLQGSLRPSAVDPDRARIGRTLVQAQSLRDSVSALESLASELRVRRPKAVRIESTSALGLGPPLPVSAVSSADIGLVDAPTPTVLSSTEEVNTTPTSFSPFGPDFTGSTALPTIGGVYDGSDATDTLTFNAFTGGTIGVSAITINVRNGASQLVDSFLIGPLDSPGQIYTLNNGLEVSFSAGSITAGTEFTVDVFDAVGSAVDPSKPLDGTRNQNPNLQDGFTVVPGAFDVNGISIAVNAGESINDVLARITASSADVTATFDAGAESVRLTAKTTGSAFDITLANDTSGFLAATKLDGASAVPGLDRDAEKPLDQVAAFASVQSGDLAVNGIGITLDTATDSLLDVLARIDASAAGVTSALDGGGQTVSFTANAGGSDLVLSGGTTGFFDALNIADGTYAASPGQGAGDPLSGLAVFSAVSTGTIRLNGVDIALDVDADSLDALVARINDADAGVTASIVADRFRLRGANARTNVEIDGGTTGFFGALGIAGGTFSPDRGPAGLTRERAQELSAAVQSVSRSVNGLFAENALGGTRLPVLTDFRADVENAVTQAYAPGGGREAGRFGIGFDFGPGSDLVFDFSSESQRLFESAVRRRFAPVRSFLVGGESPSDGLAGQLARVLQNVESRLGGRGLSGLLVDTFV